jgi:uncharacterized RDD family membrane protein YckC
MDATLDTTTGVTAARAGFWRRLGAMFIDGVLLAIVNTILVILLHRAAYALDWIVSAAYYTGFHGRTGQSPGDAAVGVQVVDLRDGTGGPIGYGRAFLRWLVSIVSGIVLLLGYLWMLWDGEKQTWHDKAVGSVVVPIR